MIKVIYFDFFNVISTPEFTSVVEKHISKDRQQFFLDKFVPLDLGDLSEQDLIEQIAKEAGVTALEIQKEVIDGPALDLRLIEYIKSLKPRYKIGLLSNAARSAIERIMGEQMNIFDIVIISSDCRLLKPTTEIYQHAIEKAGCLPEEILFTDDLEKNILGAKAVGINTLLYTTFENFKNDTAIYVD